MMSMFESDFSIGQAVHIDGHTDITAYVTGLCWRDYEGHTVEVGWIHNGTNQSAWFPAWRLASARDDSDDA